MRFSVPCHDEHDIHEANTKIILQYTLNKISKELEDEQEQPELCLLNTMQKNDGQKEHG